MLLNKLPTLSILKSIKKQKKKSYYFANKKKVYGYYSQPCNGVMKAALEFNKVTLRYHVTTNWDNILVKRDY